MRSMVHACSRYHSSPPLLNDSKYFTKLQEFSSCLFFQVPLFHVLRFVFYTLTIIQASMQKSIETQGKITFFSRFAWGHILLFYCQCTVLKINIQQTDTPNNADTRKIRSSVYTFFDYRQLSKEGQVKNTSAS